MMNDLFSAIRTGKTLSKPTEHSQVPQQAVKVQQQPEIKKRVQSVQGQLGASWFDSKLKEVDPALQATTKGPYDKVLLVIDYSTNWYELFKDVTLENGGKIIVEQTDWSSMYMQSCTVNKLVLHLKADPNPFPFSSQKQSRIVLPDMALIRNFPTGLHGQSYQNLLIGMRFARLPCVNSVHSIFMGMFRPIQVAEMMKVEERIHAITAAQQAQPQASNSNQPPQQGFKVVPMRYFFNNTADTTAESAIAAVLPPPDFPYVVKVGTAHAGYGKIRVRNLEDWDDLKSILMMKPEYYTIEPLLDVEFEYRIQKIGQHYRGFKRNSSTNWKNNWGNLTFSDFPLEDHHKMWIDECAKMFDGLDITAMDVLRLTDGSDVVLEMNDTACGLMYEHEAEDNGYIRELVLQRLNQLA
jgi:hypothetical protein